MDILKARKKAAERKQERKKQKPVEPPVAEAKQEKLAPPVEAASAPPALVAAVPASVTILPAREEAASDTPSGDDVAETKVEELELLTFHLGEEVYAIPVTGVREVMRIRSLTLVPNAPAYILGVTSLRGTVLPVLDLCVRLGLPSGVRNEKSRVVVVGTNEEDVGLVVDRVVGVLRIMPDAIKPVPENIEQGAAFLRGIVRNEDKLYILLDLEKAVEA